MGATVVPAGSRHAPSHHSWGALAAARGRLQKKALKLLGYLVVVFLVIKLIPGINEALKSLERVRWEWVIAAFALEILSEMGFVVSWRAIVDPEDVLSREGRGRRMATRVAWAQLGGGMLVPGGSLTSVGVGAWILHRFGMPTKLIAERQFNLSFLNTAVDALALIVFGLGLACGLFPGANSLALTLLPAALAAIGVVAALLIARGAASYAARAEAKHPKLALSITTLADAVQDTERLLFHRRGPKSVLGAIAYLGFDVLVLWSAFIAIHAHPAPGFAVVVMAYIIGALGGSIPLPAGLGSIGGMVGMLILYGVGHGPAVAAVLLYQAVGQLVPLIGGAIAYVFLRRTLGPIRRAAPAPQTLRV
ncbi:MAG TPA: lysylphosphatidylglycerol synthase transmembrane domain-containing protein [Solirubrobacteraceae bacterium]|nr:lysylphosphatidylglycerol synthase transmembrane domain-containing protein [Solirubrobacteraceae bacterium]